MPYSVAFRSLIIRVFYFRCRTYICNGDNIPLRALILMKESEGGLESPEKAEFQDKWYFVLCRAEFQAGLYIPPFLYLCLVHIGMLLLLWYLQDDSEPC